MLLPLAANAQLGTVEINGIYYELGWADDRQGHVGHVINAATVKANPNKYVGDVIIPATVNYEKSTYTVTSIDGSAFKGCEELTSLSIPNSVTMTNIDHFEGCSSLTTVNIPNSVTYIGARAFYGCSSLTSIVIPNSVTVIQPDAFYGCSSLTSIVIPSSVTQLDGAFQYCSSLMYLSVESGNPTYDSRGNCNAIIETSTNELILGCKNTVIPNTVTIIGGSAFAGNSLLTSVTIPASVNTVRARAFSGCSDLRTVTIAGETTFGDYAFGILQFGTLCPVKTLTINCSTITNMFTGCETLTTLNLGDNVKEIAEYAFSGCTSLTNLSIGSSLTSLDGLISIDFGKNLESISVASGNLVYDSREDCNAIIETSTNKLVLGCKNTVIPNSVTSIGEKAFYGNTSLTSVTIPTNVETVGKDAFYKCTSLESLTIRGEPTFSDSAPFGYFFSENACPIKTLTLNCAKVTNMFKGCKTLTTLILGDGVKEVAEDAFKDCSSLKSVTISSGVETVGKYAFYGCSSLESLTIEGETSFADYAFGFYDPPIKTFTFNCAKITNMFRGCGTLTTLNLGDNVKEIADRAFSGCSSLKSVAFPCGVELVGERAFSDCTSLESVIIEGNTLFGEDVFFGSPIKSLTVNCETFDEQLLNENIVTLNIGTNVKVIMPEAFFRCDGQTSFSVNGDNAFYSAIDGVLFDKTGTELLSYPRGRTAQSYVFPENITAIGDYAFVNCPNLTSINIPEGVTSIGNFAFAESEDLTTLTIPSSVTSIGFAFWMKGNIGRKFYSYITNPAEVEIMWPMGDEEDSFYGCAFEGCEDATLYVPKGTLAKYEAAEGWNSFAQIVEMREPVEIKDINGDGAVDESDAQSVSDHLLGKEVTNFNADAADVNKDGAIDILDLVLIVDKLTGGQ